MTNIRASGFDSKRQLQQHLDEQSSEDGPIQSRSTDLEELRALQLEISWLRKEVVELRESLAVASGTVEKSRYGQGAYGFLASAALIAGIAAISAALR